MPLKRMKRTRLPQAKPQTRLQLDAYTVSGLKHELVLAAFDLLEAKALSSTECLYAKLLLGQLAANDSEIVNAHFEKLNEHCIAKPQGGTEL
jgi:hypothetical protein